MNEAHLYAEIVKHQRDGDGNLVVFGKATGPDLDIDQQVMDPAWLAKAMPAWFSSGANIREQHQPIAAGVGRELEQRGDSWMLAATVVDPGSAKKVEAGVLKGFSIGVKAPQIVKDVMAPGGRVVGGQIVEVSLVDRPANPSCTLVLTKALKPGPAIVQARAIDQERRLVEVEELHDRTGEPLAALAALDLGKAEPGSPAAEGEDIADAAQAITIIARLIQREAKCLAEGETSEAVDIELLLQAINALKYFQQREKEEVGRMAAEKAAQADTVKTTEPKPEEKPTEEEGRADLIAKAVAAAVAPLAEKLEKALNQPAPGGPVLTRTNADLAKAARHDEQTARATYYDQLADQVSDPAARAGYRQLAAAARAAVAG